MVYEIGLGHPDPAIAFEIECERIQGEAFDLTHGLLASKWPFHARLSNALRIGRENAWYGQPELATFLRQCERHVIHGEPLPFEGPSPSEAERGDEQDKSDG